MPKQIVASVKHDITRPAVIMPVPVGRRVARRVLAHFASIAAIQGNGVPTQLLARRERDRLCVAQSNCHVYAGEHELGVHGSSF